MKKLLIIACIFSALLPSVAGADLLPYKEAWAFLYDFPLSYNGGVLSVVGQYHLTTGDAPSVPAGDWTLRIYDGRERVLAQHSFNPSALIREGQVELIVPYFDDGTTARFSGPQGGTFDIDLSGSRVCNDDGVCASANGENQDTCPTDCGSVAAVPNGYTAVVSQQIPFGQALGSWLLRFSLGAVGIILLVGISRMLDSRRTP